MIMIDDSIVRGTTSARIVKQLRQAGATEVHVRVTAPPFRHACYFGTDIDSPENLIANNHSIDEICQIIGADSLGYLSVESVLHLADGCPLDFCAACFDGKYPVEPPKANAKSKFETKISQKKAGGKQ